MIVFGGRLSYRRVVRQNDNTGMVITYSYLILSANHSKGVHAPQARLLDSEFLVAVIEYATKVSDYDFLSCRNIRRTADNLLWLAFTQVYCRDM